MHRLAATPPPRLQGHDRHPGLVPRPLRRRSRARCANWTGASPAAGVRRALHGQRPDLPAEGRRAGAGRAQRHRAVGGEVRRRPAAAAARGRVAGAVRGGTDRVERDGLQAEPDARRADRGARAARDLAAGATARTPPRSPVARAHARRLAPTAASSLPEAFLATDAILLLVENIAQRPRGARTGDRAPCRGADAVHGDRAVADARRAGRRRPPGAARGGARPQPWPWPTPSRTAGPTT